MIMDDKLVMSDEQAVTVSAASTDTIDTGVANSKIGDGSPLTVNCIVDTAFTASSGNISFALQHCATVDGTYEDAVVSKAHATSALVAGFTVLKVPLPVNLKRHLRGYYTCAQTEAAGKCNAFITEGGPVSDV